MKMSDQTFTRMATSMEIALEANNLSRVEFMAWAKIYRDYWTLASKAGVLSWIYSTPEHLDDRNIEVGFNKLRKQWQREA